MQHFTKESSHKIWRRTVKKLRRKRIRQAAAKERDKNMEEEEEKRRNDPQYQNWLAEQEEILRFEEEEENIKRDDGEEKWLRCELLAQKKFAEDKKKQDAILKTKEEERLRILKEFEKQELLAKQRLEEKKRLMEETKKKQEMFVQKIDDYISGSGELPEELRQTADTNPGKPICPFFVKTASCRFGDKCSRNHSRPGISKLLLLRNFFFHIRLEQSKNTEYGSDLVLEFSESELHRDYCDFFYDVVPELKKFGKLENFQTCKNCEAHLRGNVLVEYKRERDALKAYRKLHGRYYAGKQINIEFCSLITWKSAICGLSLAGKCPKGRHCNFLHVFENPDSRYPIKETGLHSSKRRASERKSASWDDEEEYPSRKRNWRWSESPESHIDNSIKTDRKDSSSYKRNLEDKSRSDRKRSHSNDLRDSVQITMHSSDRKRSPSSRRSHLRDSRRSLKKARKEKRRNRSSSRGRISKKEKKKKRKRSKTKTKTKDNANKTIKS